MAAPVIHLPYDHELEYVVADGTAYFDLDIHVNNNTRWVSKIQPNSLTGTEIGYFGIREGAKRYLSYIYTNNQYSICVAGEDHGWTNNLGTPTVTAPDVVEIREAAFYLNGVRKGTSASSDTFEMTGSIYMMAQKGFSGAKFSGRWYYTQFYLDGENLSHNFYPVVKEGIVCFYDNVNDIYVYPAVGTLTAGPISHEHDTDFAVDYGECPYDHEVAALQSDGLCWFKGSMFPDLDKSKPYMFRAPTAYIYPVVDKFSTPCLYNMATGEFYYNQGKGRLHARETVHTHDSYFSKVAGEDILRTVPGDTILLTGTDSAYSYKVVDSIPDPNTSNDKVVIPSKPVSGYSEGQVVIARKSLGKYTWTVLGAPSEGVGVVTAIRSHRLGNIVSIRWNDPDDVMNDTGTTVLRRWKRTRLVRKLGSVPTGPYDGIIVIDSSVRNYYSGNEIIDNLPPNVSGSWCYKFFCYSEDGVVSTSASCQFIPLELDWSKMSTYIQSGKASSIFAVGDEISVSADLGAVAMDPADAVWEDLVFVVAGFDQVTPTSTRVKHTMTLVSKYLPIKLAFDEEWTGFRQVTEGKVTKGIQYYMSDGSGGYTVATPTPIVGTTINELSGLYVAIGDSRKTYGTGIWKDSALRKWLNATRYYIYAYTEDLYVVPGKTYYQKNSDGTYSVATSTSPTANPKKLGWYEKASTDKIHYISDATPPLLAIKKMDQTFYNCIISTSTVTASETGDKVYTDDRIAMPSLTQVTGESNNDINEDSQLKLFSDPTKRARTNLTIPSEWWLRSSGNENKSSVKYVKVDGSVADEVATPLEVKGVCLVVNLG